MGCLTAPSHTLLKGASRMIPDGGAPIIKNESNTDIVYSLKLVVNKYYSNCSIWRYSSSGSISFGFWKGIPEIWDLSKNVRSQIPYPVNVSRILRCIKAGFAQIWSRNGIGKENDIRDSDDRSSGCGIPVRKERDYGIRALPSRAYGFCDGALYQL